MSYTVQLSKQATKQLAALDSVIRARIWNAIGALAADPRPAGCKRLKGQESWRIRVGDYRIIYDIIDDRLVVLVLKVGHRSDIYD